MLINLKKQADDSLLLGRIEGYPGDLTDLGPILRHVSDPQSAVLMCCYVEQSYMGYLVL